MVGKTSTVAKSARIKATTEVEDPVQIGQNCRVLADYIGRYTFINDGTCIFDSVTIGRFSTFARNCQIGGAEHPIHHLTTSFFRISKDWFPNDPLVRAAKPLRSTPRKSRSRSNRIEIGSDVWIGAAVLVLKGVTIGHGAVLGAGSVVTKDVPPYAVVVGNPAKIIRYRFSDEIVERLLRTAWWDLDPAIIAELPLDDVERSLGLIEQPKRPEKSPFWNRIGIVSRT
jgi:acetyltransferase-like isoleucine patch superfamily enzyme